MQILPALGLMARTYKQAVDDAARGGVVLAIIAVATLLRLYGSLGEPLWLDEAYSAYAAGKGFGFLWHVVPSYETHPPFYYSLLRCWTLLFGDRLSGLRSLGFVCGLATLPVLWAIAVDLGRLLDLKIRALTLAVWTIGFAAVSVVLVAMTREVRPYPVMILVFALALWALVRVLEGIVRQGWLPVRPYIAYLLASATMLWLHNLGALYALALGLAVLAATVRRGMPARDWYWLVGGHLAVAAAWAPALLILADQAPTWIGSTWLRFVPATLPDKLAYLYAAPGPLAVTAAVVLAALAGWRLLASNPARRILAVLALLALVPPLASILLSATVTPVFIVRTMTPVAVPAILLYAIGVAAQPGGWRRWVGLAAGLALLGSMAMVDIARRRGGPMQDWYAVTDYLAARWRPGDVLLAYPNEGALPLDFALRDRGLAIPVRPIPTAVPSIGVGGWYPTGSRGVVSLPRARLRAIATEPGIAQARTVWLMRLGANAYDRGDMFLDELSRGRRPVARLHGNPIDLIALRR